MSNRIAGRNASSVGMMEGAFFVSRTELIEWVNGVLAVNLTKVEQCASGAIYCQIVDACHPGTVKMSKVNWMARSDHEFIPNYKILQAAFDRNRMEKHIDVDKLIRAKYQDNLEFLQWMKAMWDREGAGIRDYQPVKAREGRPVPAWAVQTGPMRAASVSEKENVSTNRDTVGTPKFDPSARRRAPATGAVKAAVSRGAPAPRSGAKPLSSAEGEELKLKVLDQEEEIEALRSTLDGLENERDYYFRKLRNVEILCGTLQAKMDSTVDVASIISQVEGILYAETDELPEEQNLDPAVGMPVEVEELAPLPTEPELPLLDAVAPVEVA